jgi:hypothetical protein
MPLTDYIEENLKVLASLKRNEKLGYHSIPKDSKLTIHGSGSGMKRSAEDSILNDERFLKPITELFHTAVLRHVNPKLIGQAVMGLRVLQSTYRHENSSQQTLKTDKVRDIIQAVGRFIGTATELAEFGSGCQSPIKSCVCPGPILPGGGEPGSLDDTRCRGCRGGVVRFNPVDYWVQRVNQAKSRLGEAIWSRGTVGTATWSQRVYDGAMRARDLTHPWARFATAFLIDVFEEALESQGGAITQVRQFALIVNGSLARKQATPFSDLEFFFTVLRIEDVKPFAELGQKMWQLVKLVYGRTNSFEQDKIYREKPKMTALTTSVNCCVVEDNINDHVTFAPDRVESFFDDVEGPNDNQAVFEQMMGGRCIAGRPELFLDLKQNLSANRSRTRILNDLFGIMSGMGDVRQTIKTDLSQGNLNVNMKDLGRMCLWIPLFLGRYYGVPGRGDAAHLRALRQAGILSEVVYQMMKSVLNYITVHRQVKHASAGGEQDMIIVNPEMKKCIVSFVILYRMSDTWIRKKRKWKCNFPGECFKTLRPEIYKDLDVDQLLSGHQAHGNAPPPVAQHPGAGRPLRQAQGPLRLSL